MNMSELDEDTRRVWYQKGYHQAERDNEVLVKKLVKDITDLSAQRLDLINDIMVIKPDGTERMRIDSSGNWHLGPTTVETSTQRDMFIDVLKRGIELIENPDMPNADLRLEYLKDYLNELEIKNDNGV